MEVKKHFLSILTLIALVPLSPALSAEPLNISQGTCYTCLNGVFNRENHSMAQHSVFVMENAHMFLKESSAALAAQYKRDYCRCSNSGWVTNVNSEKKPEIEPDNNNANQEILLSSNP